MTDDMLGPSPMHIKNVSYMTDFAYDGPIILVPLSLSYPSSPVYVCMYIYKYIYIYIYIYLFSTLIKEQETFGCFLFLNLSQILENILHV